MDWEFIAPMIVGVVFLLTTGGVLVLRPIAKKLGELLEVMAREKAAMPERDIQMLQGSLETLNQRMALMEERLDFTEKLLSRGDTQRVGSGSEEM